MVDFRLTEHAREQMTQRGIDRDDVAAVLQRPARAEADEWVEKFYAPVSGRQLCVVVSHRLGTVLLIITAYLVGEE